MTRLFFLLLTACFLGLTARAQVFTLWPSAGGSTGNPLDAEIFSTEPVIINGVECEMKLGLIRQSFDDLAIALRNHFRRAQIAAAGNNLMVTLPPENGWLQRYLYIAIRRGMPVLQISMKVPEKLPENFVWPRQLPILPSATPFRVMVFPKRNALYGSFHYPPGSTAGALDQITGIAGNDWVRMAHESANFGRASGEVLIRSNPAAVMLVNFTRDGVGIVYTRPLEK